MIHYSQEDLVVKEFTNQGLCVRKDSEVQDFNQELLILLYNKIGRGLYILLKPTLSDSNDIHS